jgi:hypothetical protein
MKSSLLTVILMSALFVGCGHMNKKDDVQTELITPTSQTEGSTPSRSTVSVSADAFANSTDLTSQQKARLKAIYSRTGTQSRTLGAELTEAKTKLFETLSKRDYKSRDIAKLKNEIIAMDQKRLNLMFGALAEVQGVVGYGSEKERIYRQLRDYDLSSTSPDYNIR